MSHDLKVPKRRAEVELLLAGGTTRHVAVFLAPSAMHHDGHERLGDLLNGGSRFIAAVDLDNDEVLFIGSDTIAAARVSAELEPGEEPALGSEHEVEITTGDGHTLRGWVNYLLPPERSRLLDYLNDSAQAFVRLLENERVALVNKRHIARVRPLR